MSQISTTARERIQAQGFCGLKRCHIRADQLSLAPVPRHHDGVGSCGDGAGLGPDNVGLGAVYSAGCNFDGASV